MDNFTNMSTSVMFTTTKPLIPPENEIEIILAMSFVGIVFIGCSGLGIYHLVKRWRKPISYGYEEW
jgi:hypothetical protein